MSPGRTPAAAEARPRAARGTLGEQFAKAAVMVRTPAGRLQAERHAKQDGLRMAVFTDIEEARAYCSVVSEMGGRAGRKSSAASAEFDVL